MTSANAGAVEQYMQSPVVGNGFDSSNGYFKRDGSMTADHIAGGQAETWLGANANWTGDVQEMMDNAAKGRVGFWWADKYVSVSAANTPAALQFAVATYLIGRGHQDYLQFSTAGTRSFDWPSALYDMKVGVPTETAATPAGYLHGGAYVRHYSNGIAVANPGSTSVTVPLGASYTDVSGVAHTSVTLGPGQGAVLTGSGPTPSPSATVSATATVTATPVPPSPTAPPTSIPTPTPTPTPTANPLSLIVVSVSPATLVTKVTVTFKSSESGTYDVVIRNSAGTAVRHLGKPWPLVRGSNAFNWWGHNDAGGNVPKGTYRAVITGTDAAGQSASAVATILVG